MSNYFQGIVEITLKDTNEKDHSGARGFLRKKHFTVRSRDDVITACEDLMDMFGLH